MTGTAHALATTAAAGAGLLAGVYTAFSTMVIPALRRQDARDAAALMIGINRVAERGPFLLLFGGAAKVLLISASAAVGKSSLAGQVARDTGNLVWDLSRFSVGSGFFSGTIVDTFGTVGLDLVRRSLANGSTTLILDAADEALVRAGSRNYQAAIANLATLIADSPSPGPAALILGRPDTVEDTSKYLREQGVESQIVRLCSRYGFRSD